MNFKGLMYKAGKWVAKHSPEILTTLGVVGIGATAVTSYKAADRVAEVVEEYEELEAQGGYGDRKQTAIEIAKAMALPVSIGVASVGCFLWAYKIQNGRIQVLSGTVAALANEYRRYKNRYASVHGEEEARKFFANTETKNYVDEKNVEQTGEYASHNRSLTGVWFSESEEYLQDDLAYNCSYIEECMKRLELIIFQRGSITLNDVYDEFRMPRTRQGALLGFKDTINIDYRVYDHLKDGLNTPTTDIFISWDQPEYIFA